MILADPSNDTPPIFLAVSNAVAVPALPEASPVTLPVKGPVNLEEVTIPENVALPLDDMVAAVPRLNDVAVRFPVTSRPVEDVSAFTLLL